MSGRNLERNSRTSRSSYDRLFVLHDTLAIDHRGELRTTVRRIPPRHLHPTVLIYSCKVRYYFNICSYRGQLLAANFRVNVYVTELRSTERQWPSADETNVFEKSHIVTFYPVKSFDSQCFDRKTIQFRE